MTKGRRLEIGVAEEVEKNPSMDKEVIHLGGPYKPDFIPRTDKGLAYDYYNETNYDTFPLNKRQIKEHFDRTYGDPVMKMIPYLNPPKGKVNPEYIKRLQDWVKKNTAF